MTTRTASDAPLSIRTGNARLALFAAVADTALVYPPEMDWDDTDVTSAPSEGVPVETAWTSHEQVLSALDALFAIPDESY